MKKDDGKSLSVLCSCMLIQGEAHMTVMDDLPEVCDK